MNRKQIIRMAEKCGIPEFENNESQAENIMRFASLVAAAEREACAKLCEKYTDNEGGKFIDHEGHGYECATAIRARGQA